jgi:hypothetical protein
MRLVTTVPANVNDYSLEYDVKYSTHQKCWDEHDIKSARHVSQPHEIEYAFNAEKQNVGSFIPIVYLTPIDCRGHFRIAQEGCRPPHRPGQETTTFRSSARFRMTPHATTRNHRCTLRWSSISMRYWVKRPVFSSSTAYKPPRPCRVPPRK